jgi:flavin reductase (DIM6/NTAB) family NADH-FMN oxidoreductase RutF/pimeloyl-ACP methyl ester carboxylesterase
MRQQIADRLAKGGDTLADSRFTGFGGLGLAAELYGSENDPTVILLHGGAQDKSVWRSAATALALAGRHVICLDLRGHGESEWAVGGRYDLDAHVADLRAILASLHSRPVIVGASLGGWIAIAALGEDAAHLCTGLVLVESPPRIDESELRRVRASMRTLTEAKDSKFDPRILVEWPADALEQRLSAAASQITVPTLVIRGARSTLTSSAAAHDLARLIRNVECVEIEGAGRQVAFAQADAFNAVLLDFLERKVPRDAPEYRDGSDVRTLRDALGCFATGVTIVTATDDAGKPIGLTANSFTSVSLDPPLLLVCLARTSNSLPTLEQRDNFAVNVLHIGQQPTSALFARKDPERFSLTPYENWETGVPIIKGSLSSFECRKHATFDGGDHLILVGRVLRVRFEPRRDPLLFFRGRYRRLHFN